MLRIFLSALIMVGGTATPDQSAPTAASRKPVLLVVAKGNSGPIYRIESKVIEGDPLRAVADVFKQRGADPSYPVWILVDEELPIRTFDGTAFLIDKAGFMAPRYFVYSPGAQKVGEITFGRAQPNPLKPR